MNLINNFTTPEQSKRLLELGVPVKSADCYYSIINAAICNGIEVICDRDIFFDINTYLKDFFPCWSVGRLIEIYNICCNLQPFMDLDLGCKPKNGTYIELIINSFELAEEISDFSRLEDILEERVAQVMIANLLNDL